MSMAFAVQSYCHKLNFTAKSVNDCNDYLLTSNLT